MIDTIQRYVKTSVHPEKKKVLYRFIYCVVFFFYYNYCVILLYSETELGEVITK